MKICTFLWVYYGYPSSTYEGMNVEKMRYNCGDMLARRDNVEAGQRSRRPRLGHGARHRLRQPLGHPLLPPVHQVHAHLAALLYALATRRKRNLIARMKLIPVDDLIRGRAAAADRRLHRARHAAAARPRNSSTTAAPRRSTSVPPARRCCSAANTSISRARLRIWI